MIRNLCTVALLACLPCLALATIPAPPPAPDFTLTDTDGGQHRLAAYLEAGKTVVLEWFNPDCPFIKKHHQLFTTMNDLFESVREEDIVWLAINSSAPGKQGYGLERNRKARIDYKMEFPILIDADGAVGRAYGAKTTPHMFVITPDGKIACQGAIDDDRSPVKLGETNYVRQALAELSANESVSIASTQPYGCSVKYSY